MRYALSRSFVACVAALAGSSTGYAELIRPTGQERSIYSAGFIADLLNAYGDQLISEAVDLTPFNDAISIQPTVPDTGSFSSAGGNQQSSITDTVIEANGAAFANTEAYSIDDMGDCFAITVTDFQFELRKQAKVELDLVLSAFDDAETTILFMSPSGPGTIYGQSIAFNDKLTDTQSFTLPRGLYFLRVEAQASAFADSINPFGYGFGDYQVTLTAEIACPGDSDEDGDVDTDDFFALLQNWGACPAEPATCLWDCAPGTGDGIVGVEDFFALLQNWGDCD